MSPPPSLAPPAHSSASSIDDRSFSPVVSATPTRLCSPGGSRDLRPRQRAGPTCHRSHGTTSLRGKETMKKPDPNPSPWQTPGLSHYLIVGLVSLSMIWLVLMQREVTPAATLFPVLVGILGITIRWRLAPVVMLATLAVCLKLEFRYASEGTFRI